MCSDMTCCYSALVLLLHYMSLLLYDMLNVFLIIECVPYDRINVFLIIECYRVVIALYVAIIALHVGVII
jgi:hypothetical protein